MLLSRALIASNIMPVISSLLFYFARFSSFLSKRALSTDPSTLFIFTFHYSINSAQASSIYTTCKLNNHLMKLFLISKKFQDPKHGNWWLEFGSGVLVGYWPSFLFTHLRDHASMVQFGGEIVNSRPSGFHTSTQMGSGHFAGEGFGKASYFRNLQVVDWDNNLIPLSNLRVLADHPNCYDIQGGINRVWGNYFYYGGPGKNPRCP